MYRLSLFISCVALSLLPEVLIAEEFLGVVRGPIPEDSSQIESPASETVPPGPGEDVISDEPEDTIPDQTSFHMSVGLSDRNFRATTSAYKYTFSWLRAGLSLRYDDLHATTHIFQSLSTDYSLTAIWHNRTVISPFVGISLGGESWEETKKDVTVDHGTSATTSHFIGSEFNVSENIAINVQYVTKYYLSIKPKIYQDPSGPTSKTPVNSLSYHVAFSF